MPQSLEKILAIVGRAGLLVCSCAQNLSCSWCMSNLSCESNSLPLPPLLPPRHLWNGAKPSAEISRALPLFLCGSFAWHHIRVHICPCCSVIVASAKRAKAGVCKGCHEEHPSSAVAAALHYLLLLYTDGVHALHHVRQCTQSLQLPSNISAEAPVLKQGWLGKVLEKLPAEEQAEFKTKSQPAIKFLISKLKDLQL